MMKIKYLGHASFLLTDTKGTTVQFDPFEPGGYDGALGFGPFTDSADIVVVSHDHADHGFVEGVPGNPQVIKDELSANIAGIEFRRYRSFHDDKGGAERGANLISVCRVDGMQICHMGDQGKVLDTGLATKLGKVDILMLPVGGTFTIDSTQATELLEVIRPKICIPMHYKTPKVGFPLAPVKEFLRGKERIKELGGSEAEISVESLPKETEIWVFEAAL